MSLEIPVGRLALHQGKILFEYYPSFIERGLSISPFYLPLQAGVHVGKQPLFEGLPGVFNDSLPDGSGRLILDRGVMSKGIPHQQLTPLDRLAYVGSKGMGAFIYEPEFHDLGDSSSVLDLDELDQATKEVLGGEAQEVIDQLLELGGSSAGARPKVLLNYDRKTDTLSPTGKHLKEHEEPWMIKFASNMDQIDIGNIEYAYALMAEVAGIDMPETRLFRGKTNKAYFGVKRFDRVGTERRHMHTASGLLNADHRNSSLDYENLFRGMLALDPDIREVEKLFRLACFNVIAHNRNDHSKEVSNQEGE
ncbi:MAG: type II toxin-antitoxin system HipA family toxin [Cytophagales bacterium]|nr:type II toxin-antitoxin system HipA family toxin [Cytophagales bacterium]